MSFQPPVCLGLAFPWTCRAFPCWELRSGLAVTLLLLLLRAELLGGIPGGK